MKKNRPWKEQMVSALELPADLAYSEPIVTPYRDNRGTDREL